VFRLVGHRGFVRVNPHSDSFHTLVFHHVKLWCTDATFAADRFSFRLGAPVAARSDLSMGNSAHASLLLRSGSLAFLFTASLPSFSAPAARRFAADHGLRCVPSGSRSPMLRKPSPPASPSARAQRSSPSSSASGVKNGINVVAPGWGRAYMLYRLETTPSVVYMAW
jgi:hypothetical protein